MLIKVYFYCKYYKDAFCKCFNNLGLEYLCFGIYYCFLLAINQVKMYYLLLYFYTK